MNLKNIIKNCRSYIARAALRMNSLPLDNLVLNL